MDWIKTFATNPFLLTGLSSWAYAQIIKTVIYSIINRKLALNRLFGDGGMPSGHSATVTSLAVLAALVCGPGSVECAIALILAIVVCHDATGVRRETEKQAHLLTEIAKHFETLVEEPIPEIKLKLFVGHTPTQVAAGIILGIVNAIVMYFWIYK